MTKQQKDKAEKKADIALCKIQDIFYENPPDRILVKIEKACNAVRELIQEIENTEIKKK